MNFLNTLHQEPGTSRCYSVIVCLIFSIIFLGTKTTVHVQKHLDRSGMTLIEILELDPAVGLNLSEHTHVFS